jgi:hypothetical protein
MIDSGLSLLLRSSSSSSRVIGIGDFGGYRRLFAYLAPFGREGVGRQCAAKGGCIGL